jgi:uncharacterized membrane protein YfbV (UPF0208 family)
MRLSKIQIETLPVEVGGDNSEPFYVRGLGLSDFQKLMNEQAPSMQQLFNRFMENRNSGQQWSANEVVSLLSNAAKDMPELAVLAICLGANDTSEEAAIVTRQFSIGIQVDALSKIWALSIKQDAQLKNLQELIFGGLEKAAVFAADYLNQASTVGSLN